MDEVEEQFWTDGAEWWTAIAPNAAVKWVHHAFTDDEQAFGLGSTKRANERVGIDRPEALVFYGEVSSNALRNLQLSKMQPASLDSYMGTTPPSPEWLEERWAYVQALESEAAPAINPRRKGESPTEFYLRVADFYSWAARELGTPTQAMAIEAGVPKSTAARWVREARYRGFLPPTKRGVARG